MLIQFQHAHFELQKKRTLSIDTLITEANQYWAFIGSNGSGKSAFSSALNEQLTLQSGSVVGLNTLTKAVVSLEEQNRIIEREAERDESDITNEVFQGTPVIELLSEINDDINLIQHWANGFGIAHLMDEGFRKLSTGESRKVILIRALLSQAELIIFDEPFEGLDANSQRFLADTLSELHQQQQSMILILNRLDEVPDWVTHLGFLHNLSLLAQGTKASLLESETVKAFLTFNQAELNLPERDPCSPKLSLPAGDPLFQLNQGRVAYSDRLIFKDLDWRVEPGDHWAILGPNGCGKSTLLNLISGDHPQCYANDLTVFGIKRGSGESIWDIKQHIGIISAALQWNYKAGTNVISTVLSGLFDSIGLYSQVDEHQKNLALAWLKQVKLDHQANTPLHQLSYGEQRLVLICRAMIKQPALLILDEPCQGLDEPNRQLVLGFIELLSQQSATTLLYVTHHASDLLPCFTRRLMCVSADEAQGSTWQVQA